MDNSINVLLSWQVIVTSICIYSIILCLKRVFYITNKEISESKSFKSVLVFLNTFIGIIFAFIPNFLPGNNFSERAIVGIVCGFLSNYTYIFIKKLFLETSKKGVNKTNEEIKNDGPINNEGNEKEYDDDKEGEG
jgi:energy-converting hydrogenase Eha subunit A